MKKKTQDAIVETPIVENFENIIDESYLKYASKVIEDRALPDARDGLKPSQRRILLAMHDLGLTHTKKHLKCAKICGDCSGNYHPHGEAVIYPTLVGMAQSFGMLVPLVDPQGNFGSVDGDPPAALRYSEARLSLAGTEMIEDLSKSVVPYKRNFDDRLEEPEILPSKIPNLLINGGSGIAVGYATNLPPHNYLEISNLIEAYIKNPNLSIDQIIKIVPGPDFPNGGIVCGSSGIKDYYETGKGTLDLEGEYEIVTDAKGRETITITSFPDGGSPETFRKEIKVLVDKGEISGITDCLNYSSSKDGTKVVVEIGKNGKAKVVLNNLLKHTCLRKTYNVNNTVLNDKVLLEKTSILDLVKIFVNFRISVLEKKFKQELLVTKDRIEVLDGYLQVKSDLDKAIKIIRESENPSKAEENLLAKNIVKTQKQAKAVLALTLARLTKLEENEIITEKKNLQARKTWLAKILSDRDTMNTFFVDEQKELAKKISSSRKTKISSAIQNLSQEDLIASKDVVVQVDSSGYMKYICALKFSTGNRGGTGGKMVLDENDKIQFTIPSNTHDILYCFTNIGNIYQIKVLDIPEGNKGDKGKHQSKFIDLSENEKIVAYKSLSKINNDDYLFFTTKNGIVKRTLAKQYTDLYNGCIAIKLKDKDELVSVDLCKEKDHVLLATREGSSIRFSVSDISATGRNSQGVVGISLSSGDSIIGAGSIPTIPNSEGQYVTKNDKCSVLTITTLGYGKRTDIDDYLKPKDVFGYAEPQSRGGKGKTNITLSDKIGKVAKILIIENDEDVLIYTSDGKNAKIKAEDIRSVSRSAKGVSLLKIKDKDFVADACII